MHIYKPLIAFSILFILLFIVRQHSESNLDQAFKNTICVDVDLNDLHYSDSRVAKVNNQIDAITPNNISLGTVILDDSDQAMTTYINSLKFVFGPLLIMFAFTFLIYIAFCSQFICRCCCGNCKRDTIANPYSRLSIQICSGFGIFFLMFIFGTSIAGIFFSVSFQTSSQQFECVTYTSFYDLLYGQPKQNWIGVYGLSQQVQYIQSNLSESVNAFANYRNPEVDTSPIETAIQAMYTANQNKQINNPEDPSTMITPSLIQILGPPTLQSTITGSLQQEYTITTQGINQAMNEFDQGVQNLNQSYQSIQDSLQSSISSINQFTDELEQIDENNQQAVNNLDQFNTTIKNSFLSVFVFTLVISILGMTAIVLMLVMKIAIFKCPLYTSWILLQLFTIIGFFISSILFLSSVVTFQMCDVVNDMLTNSTDYQLYSAKLLGDQFYNDTNICMFGNGDMASQFGIDDSLNDLNQIAQNLQLLQENASVIESTPPLTKEWMQVVTFQKQQPLKATNITDNQSNQTFTVPPSSSQAISASIATNSWSDYSMENSLQSKEGQCKVTQDQVVFNMSNCEDGSVEVGSSNPGQDIGGVDCVNVYDSSFISTRLNAADFSSCKVNVKKNYETGYNNLVDYRQNLDNNILVGLNSSLQKIQQSNEQVYDQLQNSFNTITTFSKPLDSMLYTIGNNETGLANNLNCKFFKTDMDYLNITFCKSYMVDIYTITVILIIICAFGLVASCFLFFSTQRFPQLDNYIIRLVWWTLNKNDLEFREGKSGSSIVKVHSEIDTYRE